LKAVLPVVLLMLPLLARTLLFSAAAGAVTRGSSALHGSSSDP
jgi:hypothetical protein